MLKIYQLRLKQNTFDVTLKYKGVSVRVAFVDGNTYNGTPAKCYTNNAFKQKAIEASQMFKDREIVLERQVEEESDRKAKKVAMQQKPANKPVAANKPVTSKPSPALEPVQEPVVTATEGTEKKVFGNLAEAIMFIAQEYKVQVTSASEARKVLKEHGVTATIKNG